MEPSAEAAAALLALRQPAGGHAYEAEVLSSCRDPGTAGRVAEMDDDLICSLAWEAYSLPLSAQLNWHISAVTLLPPPGHTAWHTRPLG